MWPPSRGTTRGCTHASDVWLAVIKGAYLYKDDVGEKRVGHWSGGDQRSRSGHG
jgi:hypothetical protein